VSAKVLIDMGSGSAILPQDVGLNEIFSGYRHATVVQCAFRAAFTTQAKQRIDQASPLSLLRCRC